MAPSDDPLRRFPAWARWTRRIGHLLRRIEFHPDELEHDERRVVMVANHRSLSDVFIAVETIDHWQIPTRCLVRAKYFDNKIAGAWLRAIGCIPAGDGKRESIATAVETLDAGRSVAVMIEGKIVPPDRREADGMGEIRGGFVEIARKADAPIMPIAVTGSDDIWASRGRIFRLPWRGRPLVHVRTGPPITVTGKSDDEVLTETRAALAGLLALDAPTGGSAA